MTEESKVEVELHDEKINDIVEETLEEKTEPKGGSTDVKAPSEDDSVASVDKAAKATSKTNLPIHGRPPHLLRKLNWGGGALKPTPALQS